MIVTKKALHVLIAGGNNREFKVKSEGFTSDAEVIDILKKATTLVTESGWRIPAKKVIAWKLV